MKDLKEKGGHKWLEGLRKCDNPMEVQSLLCSFNGVGRKVDIGLLPKPPNPCLPTCCSPPPIDDD